MGTIRHSLLITGVVFNIFDPLRRDDYNAFLCGLCYGTPRGDFLFPDASVAGEPMEMYPDRDDVVLNPILVIEVLSPETHNYDRGRKFESYRQIPSLRDYLLVHHKSIFVEHFSKNADGSWTLREYRGAGAKIPLPNVESELDLGRAYQRFVG